MNYLQVTFTITPDSEINREILTAYLAQLDFESFDEAPSGMNAFLPSQKINIDSIEQTIAGLPFNVNFSVEETPDVNWNEEWEKNYFQPLLIGGECLVRAPFHKDFPEATFEIIIEPNMAFGTGNHETTSLMIEYLLELDLLGLEILDMGCGTGILGILACKKGCEEVMAIDIDPRAIESTTENARLNRVYCVKPFTGDSSLLEDQQFDIILANIQKNVILQDMDKYATVLKEDGILIVSGFYYDDVEEIIGRAAECFLEKVFINKRNNWVAVKFRKVF